MQGEDRTGGARRFHEADPGEGKIPEDKMNCLNLTYRCKDPNTGTQMTLEGVNSSALTPPCCAVLCRIS